MLCWVALAMSVLGVPIPAFAAIAYVQSVDQNPDSGTTLSVSFASAQSAGDLNVVFVGWSDTSSTVQSVTDTNGNTYVAAVGPTRSGTVASQTVYYAKNVKAGANTVTVTFSTNVSWPDVRIIEYSGVDTANPFDAGAGAGGSGTAQNSGSLTTTNATDVLVASNYIASVTSAADPTFTQRLYTEGGEIVEDRLVSTAGTYSAGSTQQDAAWWIIQVAAFRAASSGADTQPPSAPSGLKSTAAVASSSQITLNWSAATDNVGIANYRIERCQGSGCAGFAQIATTTATTHTDVGLASSTIYSYRIRAADAAGNLSGYSTVTSATSLVSPGGTVSYTYDTASRLSMAVYPDSTGTVYSLDAAGNRTTVGHGAVSAVQFSPTSFTANDTDGTAAVTLTRTNGSLGTASVNYSTSDGTALAGTNYTKSRGTVGWKNGDSANKTINIPVRATGIYGPNTSFTVTLSEVSGATLGTSTATVTVVDTSPVVYPTAPTGLSASVLPAEVDLQWNPSTDPPGGPGIANYQVLRNGTAVGAKTAATSFKDTTVASGTTYSYTVVAYDKYGTPSQPSAAATVTTLYQITDSVGNVVSSAAALYRSAIVPAVCGAGTGNGPCNYVITQRYGSQLSVRTDTGSAPTGAWSNQSLAPGYFIGQGANYMATYATAAVYGGYLPPSPPTGLTGAAVSSSQVNLSWTAAVDTSGVVVGYRILRNGSQIGTSATNSYSDTTTTCNASYSYTVRAYDGASPPDVSDPSAPFAVSTPNTVAPSVPAGLTSSSVAATQVVLTWNPSSDSCASVAGYNVYRNGALIGSAAGSSYTDTGLSSVTNYSYTVAAYDASSPAHVSAQSAAYNVTTAALPYQITDSLGNVIAAASTLYRSAIVPALCGPGTAGGPCNYVVVQRYGSQLTVRTDTSSSPTGPWNNISLAPGYSIGSGGTYMATFATSATYGNYLPPGSPPGLTATAVSPTQVNLSWAVAPDSSGVVAGYQIFRNGSQIATTAGTTYSDTGVAGATTYSYTVASYDTASPPNVSPQSAPVSVTTPAALIQITDANGRSLSSLYRTSIVPAICGSGTGNGPCNYIVVEISNNKNVRTDSGPSMTGGWTNQSLAPGYSIGTGANVMATYATSAVYGQ